MDWRTVFNDNDTTIKLVFSVFLLACSAGGLTVLSLGANLYLVHAFRRLQSLPTDSNPYIEDDEEQLLSEKRWSGSTANSETPFLGHRTMPFAATRIANEKPMVTGGKYTYQTLSVDNFEMGGEDVRRETLGSGYGDVKNGSDHVPSYAAPSYATTVDEDERFPAPSRTNTMSSLKRTHAIRPSSIAGTLKGLKRNSYAPPPPEHGSGESGSHDLKRHSSYDPSTAVEADGHDIEGLRASVVSSGSWGSSAGVQGFSKAAMLKNVPVPEKRPDLLISKTWGSAEGVQGFSKSAMLKDVPLSENKRPGVVSSKTWGSAEGVDPFSKAAIPDDFPVPENQRASVVSSRSFGSSGGIQGFSKAAMLDEFPVSESQRASGVSSGGVQGFSKAAMLDEFPVPESHRASVVSAKSFGSSGGVQGFSKAAMLEGGVGRTRRFNKTSKEGK